MFAQIIMGTTTMEEVVFWFDRRTEKKISVTGSTKGYNKTTKNVYFYWKKFASLVHRMYVDVYGVFAPSDKTFREWFRLFKRADVSVDDKKRSDLPKTFKDEERC